MCLSDQDDIDEGDLRPRRSAGEDVAGYRLERPLGQGGMADVWLGQSANGSLAAVKLLRASSAAIAKILFEREKRVLLRLQHPNLVPIFDVGDQYIISAYIEGADLRHRMRAPIPVAEAVNIVCEVASALSTVHEAGVVHCDVKPANILLDHEGSPFLADFGIATFVDDVPNTDTTKLVRGTPAYMAPEQKHGISTPKSDQYSLAKTLLIMLGGMDQLTVDEAIYALPPAYEALRVILLKALSQEPAKRYDSVALMAAALKECKLEDTETATRLAPLRRGTENYSWVQGHHKIHRFGEHIYRADYRLSDLEEAGLLDAESIAAFREETGCTDFGWSMYARDERLGPINAPAALGRARQSVVFLHGLFTDREVWKDVAIGISRANGMAVALTPDIPGFGESTLGKQIPQDALSLRGVVHAMNAWLKLLAIVNTSTAVVGHSYSAAALMCAREAELAQGVHTICLTPAFFYYSWRLRLKTRLDAIMSTILFTMPRWVAGGIARFMFRRDPSLKQISDQSCDAMAESALRLGGRRVGRLFGGVSKARPAPPQELRHCTVVTTPDDPLVSAELSARSIVNAGIPESQWYRLIYGGHFPHLVDEAHPEWGARNVHELVSLVDAVLDKARAESSLKELRRNEDSSSGSTIKSSDTEELSSLENTPRSAEDMAVEADGDDPTVLI